MQIFIGNNGLKMQLWWQQSEQVVLIKVSDKFVCKLNSRKMEKLEYSVLKFQKNLTINTWSKDTKTIRLHKTPNFYYF